MMVEGEITVNNVVRCIKELLVPEKKFEKGKKFFADIIAFSC